MNTNLKREFAAINRKIDKLTLGLTAIYTELGIKTTRSVPTQVGRIENLLQSLSHVVGNNSSREITSLTRDITREINGLKRALYDMREQVSSLNSNIGQEYKQQKEMQNNALVGISENVSALESIVSASSGFTQDI